MPHRLRALPEPVLPPPSAELVLFQQAFFALVEALPKRKREKVIRALHERMDALSDGENVLLIRPVSDRAAVLRARRQAKAWWMGVWGARM